MNDTIEVMINTLINDLILKTGYLPNSFYENNKFNKIVLDCMPVEELKAFLVSFIKQAKEKGVK